MKTHHGVPELLVPSIPAVGVAACHRFAAELVMADAAKTMAKECSSDLERHAEVLQPGCESMPEVVEVEALDPYWRK